MLHDNTIRWNGTYLSIQRAIELRKRFEIFYYEHRDDLKDDLLSDRD
jgi:hypothetical protein